MSPDQIGEIAKQGLLGVLLFLSIGAIIYLYKGRMSDWKEIRETLNSFTGTLRDWVGANEPRTRALEANVRAMELLTAELVGLRNDVTSLRDVISDRTGEALKSNREMREVVLTMKEQVGTIYSRCTRMQP